MFGPTAKDTGTPLLPGLHLKGDAIAGRYRIEKLVGAGSSGFVVQARHIYLRRKVTLKILTSMTTAQQKAQRRCLAAAHVAASLRGPHVARIVDTGFTEEGMPFVATERLEGRTLADELRRRGTVPAEEAVRWILQVCEALAEAHAIGIVHGDLKPQNIFLVGEDAGDGDAKGTSEPSAVKVLDFGMVTPFGYEADDAALSTWFASPAYLSPEQLRDPHDVDARVDIWALGVILHQLISGKMPFDGSSVSGMLVAVAHDEPAVLTAPEVPYELARVVQACLAKDAAARPPDVVALARELTPFAGSAGPALLARIETTAKRSTTEPRATAVEASEACEARADEQQARCPSPADATSNEAPSRSRVDPNDPKREEPPEVVAFQRRRYGAMLMAAAATLVFVRLFARPAASGRPEVALDIVDPPLVPREEIAPLPFVPHSFDESDSPSDRQPVPTPAPAPLSHLIDTVTTPAARPLVRALPASKPKSSLALGEKTHGDGFTHPSRLTTPRK